MKFTTKKQKNCSVIFMSNDFSTVIKTAKTVTLIGSRKPPERIANIAVKIGRALNERGIRAYSGGAPGMDSHFLFDYSPDNRCIILPENGFNGLFSNGKDIIDFRDLNTQKAADEARKVAGNFDTQNEYVKILTTQLILFYFGRKNVKDVLKVEQRSL